MGKLGLAASKAIAFINYVVGGVVRWCCMKIFRRGKKTCSIFFVVVPRGARPSCL
jgi:hypothetical protein